MPKRQKQIFFYSHRLLCQMYIETDCRDLHIIYIDISISIYYIYLSIYLCISFTLTLTQRARAWMQLYHEPVSSEQRCLPLHHWILFSVSEIQLAGLHVATISFPPKKKLHKCSLQLIKHLNTSTATRKFKCLMMWSFIHSPFSK